MCVVCETLPLPLHHHRSSLVTSMAKTVSAASVCAGVGYIIPVSCINTATRCGEGTLCPPLRSAPPVHASVTPSVSVFSEPTTTASSLAEAAAGNVCAHIVEVCSLCGTDTVVTLARVTRLRPYCHAESSTEVRPVNTRLIVANTALTSSSAHALRGDDNVEQEAQDDDAVDADSEEDDEEEPDKIDDTEDDAERLVVSRFVFSFDTL